MQSSKAVETRELAGSGEDPARSPTGPAEHHDGGPADLDGPRGACGRKRSAAKHT